jgi:hypothetical protein
MLPARFFFPRVTGGREHPTRAIERPQLILAHVPKSGLESVRQGTLNLCHLGPTSFGQISPHDTPVITAAFSADQCRLFEPIKQSSDVRDAVQKLLCNSLTGYSTPARGQGLEHVVLLGSELEPLKEFGQF